MSNANVSTKVASRAAVTKAVILVTGASSGFGRPAAEARLADYNAGPCNGFGEQVQKAFAAIVPDDADVAGVADAIVSN